MQSMRVPLINQINAHTAPVYALATGESPEWLFTGGGDRIVALWNVRDGKQQSFAIKTDASVFSLAYNHTMKKLFIGCSNGMLHVVDTISKNEIKAWTLDAEGLFDLKWDASRNRMLVAGGNGILTVVDCQTNEVLRSIPLSNAKIRRVDLSKNGDLLAIADNSGQVHVLDAENYQAIETMNAHEEGCTAVLWHPHKPVLITGGKDAIIRCWSMDRNYQQVFHFAAHQSTIYDLVYHANSNNIVSCSRDKSIKWWNPDTFDPVRKVDYASGGHKHSVNRLLAQEQWINSAGDDRSVILFGA